MFTRGEPLMNADEIMELVVEVRRLQELFAPGPLAIVMPRERFEQFARLLGALAVPKRPLPVLHRSGGWPRLAQPAECPQLVGTGPLLTEAFRQRKRPG